MHDPKAVAFDIRIPVPRRDRWREHARGDVGLARRWGVDVVRRTNPENAGERVYRWWRPCGYRLWIAGRTYDWRHFATVWHNEPRGRDSGTVCKHRRYADETPAWIIAVNRYLFDAPVYTTDEFGRPLDRPVLFDQTWKWHVRHWSLQVIPEQNLRRFLFERCADCGRRFPYGYSPVGTSWDAERPRWWRIYRENRHHECADLAYSRRHATALAEILARAVTAYRVARDLDELDAIDALSRSEDVPGDHGAEFRARSTLLDACGWRWVQDRTDGAVEFYGNLYVKTAATDAAERP